MRIFFSGVGEYRSRINHKVEYPCCPRKGEEVTFPAQSANIPEVEATVRTVVHCPFEKDYDVYVVVAP